MTAAQKTMRTILAATLLVSILVAAPAAVPVAVAGGSDGGIPGSFLRFGASARSLALGNAVAGVSDDVATAYWNPAGLAQLRTMEITGMGATLFEDTQYGFLALGLPTESWGTFALGATMTTSGEFQRATIFDDLDETFSEQEGIFSVSYANGGSRFAWGFTLKHVSQEIAGARGSATGADVGLFFRPHRNLSVGAAVQNALAPTITLDEDEEELVRSGRVGLALRFLNDRLLVMSDLVKTRFRDAGLHSGLELWPVRTMALRGGWDSELEQWSAGAGLRWENWQFDYAFVDTDLGAKNVVSATLRFGVPYGVKMQRDRALFSPSGSDRDVTFAIATAVRGDVESWRLEVRDGQDRLVKSMQGNGNPPDGVSWGGDDEDGRLVPDGTYEARVVILDALGQHWDSRTDVEVLGFQDRTRVPIRVEISGSGNDGDDATGGKDR
ncbi:MAG: PorV/PorQ family protein [Candidatus Krumholzibacteriia bacterium]